MNRARAIKLRQHLAPKTWVARDEVPFGRWDLGGFEAPAIVSPEFYRRVQDARAACEEAADRLEKEDQYESRIFYRVCNRRL